VKKKNFKNVFEIHDKKLKVGINKYPSLVVRREDFLIIMSSNDTNSANHNSTNLVNVIKGIHELNAPNISNLNSHNPFSHSNIGKFSFCLS